MVDLINSFRDNCQVTFSGEYTNGQKVGKQDIILDSRSNIGGGSYDQFFQKNGLWIDLSDGFKSSNQVVCNGVYKNGKKIGS